jgi:hypothetical protein
MLYVRCNIGDGDARAHLFLLGESPAFGVIFRANLALLMYLAWLATADRAVEEGAIVSCAWSVSSAIGHVVG